MVDNSNGVEKTGSSIRLQIGFCFFAFILIGANDGALGVLLPSMMYHYNIDKATISYIFLSATIGYLCSSFSSGLLLDKLGQRMFLVMGPTVFLVASLLMVSMPIFPLLLLVTFLIGFGGGNIDAGLNIYIAGLPRNSVYLNYLHAFYGFGALLGPLIASTILAVNLGWNNVYLIWALFSFITLVAFLSIFKPKPRASTADHIDVGDTRNVLRQVIQLRVVWLGAIFLLFYVGGEVSLGSWSYSFLTQERHIDILYSGWAVSGYWLGLTAGRLVLGKVAEKYGNKRLIQYCLMGVVAGILLTWLVPYTPVSFAGLILAGFSFGPIFPTTIAMMSGMVRARLLPSAIGFMASLGSVGGALFPWVAGNLAQNLGLWTLLPYVIVICCGMLVVWFLFQSAPTLPLAETPIEQGY